MDKRRSAGAFAARRVRSVLTAAVFAAVLALRVLTVPVFAAEPEDRKDCSITLLLGEGEDHLRNPLRGGSIALYQVAAVHFGDELYYDAAQGQFAGSETLSQLRKLTQKELDRQNAPLTDALLKEAEKTGIEPLREGKVRFSGLSVGLYLLCQKEVSEEGRCMNAFLLSVPDAAGDYAPEAAPKPGLYRPTTPLTPTPTPPPEIPQTGQLWWPVLLLGFLGLVLLALGFLLRPREHSRD